MVSYLSNKQKLPASHPATLLAVVHANKFPIRDCALFERVMLHPLYFIRRCIGISMDLMINEEIRDREVRVIDQNGEQRGVMPIAQAHALADAAQLDLVKIVPNAQPPVCKLMDYDKYRFEQSKKEREIRKNQKVVVLKEVQLSATIEENDVLTKAKNAIRFLSEGDKVKVSIRFRGRQITHTEVGMKVMQDFIERIKDVGIVERRPLLEGRHMIMILVPKDPNAKENAKEIARENAKENKAAAQKSRSVGEEEQKNA